MRQITRALENKEQTLNELFSRVEPADTLSNPYMDNDLLSFSISGGLGLWLYGSYVTITDADLALTDGSTNYIELSVTNAYALSVNTTGFTPGRVPLFEVVTASGAITTITDRREFLNTEQPGANHTQKFSYAANVEPDAQAGRYVEVGLLTGAITIDNPINAPATDGSDSGVGYELYLLFKQDGTGGRSVTLDTDFIGTIPTGAAADEQLIAHFIYDRGKWVLVNSPTWG